MQVVLAQLILTIQRKFHNGMVRRGQKEVFSSCGTCGLSYSVCSAIESAEVAFCPFCGEEAHGEESLELDDDEFYAGYKYQGDDDDD